MPTPGHSSGSVSLIVEDTYAFTGDTFFSRIPGSIFPLFADDIPLLLQSWEKLLELNCQRYYPGHGNAFNAEKLRRALAKAKKKYT